MNNMMIYIRCVMMLCFLCASSWSMVWAAGDSEEEVSVICTDLREGAEIRESSLGLLAYFEHDGEDDYVQKSHAYECILRTEHRIIFLVGRYSESLQLPCTNSPLPKYSQALREELVMQREMLVCWRQRCAELGVSGLSIESSNMRIVDAILRMGVGEFLDDVFPCAATDDDKKLEKKLEAERDVRLRSQSNMGRVFKRMASQLAVKSRNSTG